MSDNRQLLSTHVYSKESSLLVDGIVNWPRGRQTQAETAEIGDQRNQDSRTSSIKMESTTGTIIPIR